MTAASFTRRQRATEADLPGMIEAIEAWLEQAGVPPADVARLMIAFDEVLSNITHHGGGTIDLAITRDRGYAIDANETHEGLTCIARPIFGAAREGLGRLRAEWRSSIEDRAARLRRV